MPAPKTSPRPKPNPRKASSAPKTSPRPKAKPRKMSPAPRRAEPKATSRAPEVEKKSTKRM